MVIITEGLAGKERVCMQILSFRIFLCNVGDK